MVLRLSGKIVKINWLSTLLRLRPKFGIGATFFACLTANHPVRRLKKAHKRIKLLSFSTSNVRLLIRSDVLGSINCLLHLGSSFEERKEKTLTTRYSISLSQVSSRHVGKRDKRVQTQLKPNGGR